jgi:hypothetical protein
MEQRTVAWRCPYDRKAVAEFVSDLSRLSSNALIGLAVAVDHRVAKERTWVLATFDLSVEEAKEIYSDLVAVSA